MKPVLRGTLWTWPEGHSASISAPQPGKTFAMLNEGRRRREYGEDVVVGFVEPHGRAKTAAQLADLEIVPRKQVRYRDSVFEEMDVDALLVRRPQVALVDELAHTNVPGSRNEKRWQDVEALLDAGINVISTPGCPCSRCSSPSFAINSSCRA